VTLDPRQPSDSLQPLSTPVSRRRALSLFAAGTGALAAASVALPASAHSSPAPAPARSSQSVPTADQEYVWIAANVAHPFYTEGKAGWDAAARYLGVKAQLVGPVTADVQAQVTMMEQAIAKPTTGGILLYPVDVASIAPIARKAMDAGIAVILGNGDYPSDKSVRDAFVGTANVQLGAAAAGLVAEALGGKGKVGIVSFATADNHKQRIQGFQDQVKAKYPDIEVIGIAPEDGTPESAKRAAAAFLQANPTVNLLWATDASSGAVAQAIKEAGLAGKVLSVGTDRTAEQLDAIRDGTVYATIAQDTFAEEFVSLNFLYWKYNKMTTLPDETITRPLVITKANVDQG